LFPGLSFALCDGVVLPSEELSLQRDAAAAGAEALCAEAPESVEKNIVRISAP